MPKELIERYAPMALVVISIIFQWSLFVTPERLEIKHREIMNEVSEKYWTKNEADNFKNQVTDMQKKLDKIYDYIMTKRGA